MTTKDGEPFRSDTVLVTKATNKLPQCKLNINKFDLIKIIAMFYI